jgi:F0F1-type ATP synthase membrane subunit b/b'
MDIDKLVHPFLKISDEIAFNDTLVIQLVIFLAAYFILKPLLWQPMLAELDRRRSLTRGQKDQAELEEAEIIRLENEYTERIRAARLAASEERTKTRAAAQEASKSLLDSAKAEAGKAVASIRGEISAASKKAREDLNAEADSTAKVMTAKILGRTV